MTQPQRWKRWVGYYFVLGGSTYGIQRAIGGAGNLTDLAISAAAVAFGVYWIITNPKSGATTWIQGRSRSEKAAFSLGLVIVAVLIYQFVFLVSKPRPPKSAFDLAIERMMARVKDMPDIKGRLEQKLKAACPGPAARCRDVDVMTGMQLVRNGLARLDSESALKRVSLMRKLLGNVDEATCAAIERGTAEPSELRVAVETLDPRSLDAWMDIVFRAAVAELRETPGRQLTEKEIALAEEEFVVQLTPEELDRFAALPEDDAKTSDMDLCWAARTLYERLPNMREPHRSVMVLSLVKTGLDR